MKNNMKNPMQYFREGYETRKKMMLGGMVLDEPEFDVGDPQKKKMKAAKKEYKEGVKQWKQDCKGPMCQRKRKKR